MNQWGIKFNLPDKVAEKVRSFGETSYGATTVTLILKDGRRVPHVAVAWGNEVIKAKDAEDESLLSTLTTADVADAVAEK